MALGSVKGGRSGSCLFLMEAFKTVISRSVVSIQFNPLITEYCLLITVHQLTVPPAPKQTHGVTNHLSHIANKADDGNEREGT